MLKIPRTSPNDDENTRSSDTSNLTTPHHTNSTPIPSMSRPNSHLHTLHGSRVDLRLLQETLGDPFDDTLDSLDSDSLELIDAHTTNDDFGNQDQDQDQDIDTTDDMGSETILGLLRGHKDLSQQMAAIEQEIGWSPDDTSNSRHPFEPTLLRVLYMGSATTRDKQRFFRKLTDGLAAVVHSKASHPQPHIFKERKHHLLMMSVIPDRDDTRTSAYEDNGVSVIEADFTSSSPIAIADPDGLNDTVLSYVSHQCDDPVIWLSNQSSKGDFKGFAYPEKTPNGIDLCVYFHDGSQPQDKGSKEYCRLENEISTLWRIKRLKIPIMAILSTPHAQSSKRNSIPAQTSSPPPSPHRFPMFSTRPMSASPSTTASAPLSIHTLTVAERRSQLADLLARFKIRCVDITCLDIEQPSFQRRSSRKPSATTGLEYRMGHSWAISSITSPEPYQILTIDQFSNVHQNAVSELLRHTRRLAAERERKREIIRTQERVTEDKAPLIPPTATKTCPLTLFSLFPWLLLLAIVMATYWLGGFCGFSTHCLQKPGTTKDPSQQWSASLHLANESDQYFGFLIRVRQEQKTLWPPVDPVATLSNASINVARSDEEGHYLFRIPKPVCGQQTDAFQNRAADVRVAIPQVIHVLGSPILFESLPCYQPPLPSPLPISFKSANSHSRPSLCPVPSPTLVPSIPSSVPERLSWSEWTHEALYVMNSLGFYWDNWRLLAREVL